MKDEQLAWVAVGLIPSLTPGKRLQLARHCQGAAGVLKLGGRELRELGLPRRAREFLQSQAPLQMAGGCVRAAREADAEVVVLTDPRYPPLLGETFDPPLALYVRGDPKLLAAPAVAVVGSRACSLYGREVTARLAGDLARAGLTVVSGMARGVDSRAHRAALESNARTVAVLGSGVDVVYPRENVRLYEQLVRKGCVASELPCGSAPLPRNFPARNRIISGLSLGTLVTEASESSGSLITAHFSLEQNRLVWAVPGNITSPVSRGTNALIQQGARPVLQAQDILEDFAPQILGELRQIEEGSTPPSHPLLRHLHVDRAVHVDELAVRARMNVPELSGALLQLELEGLVEQLPGRCYRRQGL